MPVTFSQLVIGTLVSLLVLVSVTGNLMVCFAIWKDSRLRRVENAFLASLAASDLMVAILVMPPAGLNDLCGSWVLGPWLCDIWIATDIMCSTASIFNMCAIALDRYLHIKDPFRYSEVVTCQSVCLILFIIWSLSATVSAFPISLGLHRSSLLNAHPSTCAMDLSPLFAVTSSIISFCLPCTAMIAIYGQLYVYSRQHQRNIAKYSSQPPAASISKAALTIGVIMGIFIVCWTPFFSANVLVAFCKTCVSSNAFKVFSWLGYSNSMFNPIVYTLLNSEFRDAFMLILRRRLSSQSSASYSSRGKSESVSLAFTTKDP